MSVHKHTGLAMSSLPANAQISRPDQLQPLILWYELTHPNTPINPRHRLCKCVAPRYHWLYFPVFPLNWVRMLHYTSVIHSLRAVALMEFSCEGAHHLQV